MRKKETWVALQFNPPMQIPECMTAEQSAEGFWYAESDQGKTYLPGEWCVIDSNGEHHQFTNDQFLDLFETAE